MNMPHLSITLLLAIETSCDETAAAVIEDGWIVRSNLVATQAAMHAKYGGVFPEVASRMHVETITPVIREALDQASVAWPDLSAVAVTYGPGLPGSLLVGLNAAKGIAFGRGLPLIGVNHLEGHVYSHWLKIEEAAVRGNRLAFPLLILIVSGGHTELILMRDHLTYERLGATLDDAAGEAFDKVARLLGLGYPGGPAIERIAASGDPMRFEFALPKVDHPFAFSFSGIKTAALRIVQGYGETDGRGQAPIRVPVPDLSASFQRAVVQQLVEKTVEAAHQYRATEILLSGGVSANKVLREAMQRRASVPVRWPPLWLCTDNAAMIGAAGHYRFVAGRRDGWDLDVAPNLKLT
ncbi:MAG TPA: tRNA (adenosine(37)-N6)-threonylcarbamoyltransferase complex transferase subunit TsaD [Anaerolineae bacterium]|nr:tRNA (adenosine(37)-N6)-threonylcarbamoyltransferase complex transferase subunit TsaD [Anaerolineae bacterium]